MLRRYLAAVAGLAFGIFGTEMTFGQLRPENNGAQAVLYSIEVRNDAGDLLASPMLVGEEGRPVHLNYVGPRSELNMSLDLDPQPDGPGVCLGYKLSIDDGFAHAGRLGVSYGVQRSVNLRGGGETLRLSLVMARADSPQFERILKKLRRPAA
ncbi:MAG TPA: hypothetical protein VLW85_19580 [Myxococcales bacterium]|nr:hypothetical protein [Myxococcales bacterium]